MLQKEAIEAWREGGAQVPQVIVINGQEGLPLFPQLDRNSSKIAEGRFDELQAQQRLNR